MNQIAKLNIAEFFSVTAQLCFQASKIIGDVHKSNDLQKQMKGEDDPVTIADIKAQTLIIKGLRQFWPSLNIIGEESVDYKGEIILDELNPKLFPQAIFDQNQSGQAIPREIDIDEKVLVWIDPLDGTLSFVTNELDAVTTLIGLSIGKEAVLGVIGKPFSAMDEQGQYHFSPQVYFGNSVQQKVFYAYAKDYQANQQMIPYELIKPYLQTRLQYSITTQNTRLKKEDELKIMQQHNPSKLLRIGGSGKKILMILEGVADFYLYVSTKTKRWDICPGDALIKCFGGQLHDLYGQVYSYDRDDLPKIEDPYCNDKGLIATLYSGEVQKNFIIQSKGFL